MILNGGGGGPYSFPGDPSELYALALSLTTLGRGLAEAADEIASIDAGDWKGKAADAFRAVMHQQPEHYVAAGDAFLLAGNAVTGYADALSAAQTVASTANSLYLQGEAMSAQWQEAQAAAASGSPKSAAHSGCSVDPGAALIQEAATLMQRATADLDQAAAGAARALRAAEQGAPRKPGLFSQLLGDAWGIVDEVAWKYSLDPVVHFVEGVGEGTAGLAVGLWDLGGMAWRSSADYWLDHKAFEAQMQQWSAMGGEIEHHPLDFAKKFGEGLLDWSEWTKDPSKALGELVPGIVLTIATAGAGAAAKGTEAGADAADVASEMAAAGARAAEDAAPRIPAFIVDSGLTESSGSLVRTATVVEATIPDATSIQMQVAGQLADTADSFRSAAAVIRSANAGTQQLATSLKALNNAELAAGVSLNAVYGTSPGGSTAAGYALNSPAATAGRGLVDTPNTFYVTTNGGDPVAIFVDP